MGDGESALRIRLPAVPAAAAIVRERLRRWLRGLGWPDAELDDVVLAVHEAVCNSVEHGYAETAPGEVEILGTRVVDGHRQRSRFTVRDDGLWRPPREPGYRGRGLVVMRGCMEEVTVAPGERGTEVELLSRPVPVPVTTGRLLESVERDGHRVARAARAGRHVTVRSCPDWTGGDLLAHLSGYARYLPALFAGTATMADPVPPVSPEVALRDWDDDLEALLTLLSTTPADAPVPNWSVRPDTAGFWVRRSAHEFAVHRWDADTTRATDPDPVPADIARDGIAEYFEAFAATAVAAGLVPRQPATLALELTDSDERLEYPLPEPGPVTTVRGTTSDLLLALWHRRDLLAHHVDGDRGVLEHWPRI